MNGKLARNRQQLADIIASFEGKEIEIVVDRYREKRSNAQNRWYWGVAVPLVQLQLRDIGHQFGKEQTHEFIKYEVAQKDASVIVEETVIESTGEIIHRIKSTTELSTFEFSQFKDVLQQWAAEAMDLVIPDPNEQVEMEIE